MVNIEERHALFIVLEAFSRAFIETEAVELYASLLNVPSLGSRDLPVGTRANGSLSSISAWEALRVGFEVLNNKTALTIREIDNSEAGKREGFGSPVLGVSFSEEQVNSPYRTLDDQLYTDGSDLIQFSRSRMDEVLGQMSGPLKVESAQYPIERTQDVRIITSSSVAEVQLHQTSEGGETLASPRKREAKEIKQIIGTAAVNKIPLRSRSSALVQHRSSAAPHCASQRTTQTNKVRKTPIPNRLLLNSSSVILTARRTSECDDEDGDEVFEELALTRTELIALERCADSSPDRKTRASSLRRLHELHDSVLPTSGMLCTSAIAHAGTPVTGTDTNNSEMRSLLWRAKQQL